MKFVLHCPQNKSSQRNSQHCKKLHNKMRNKLYNLFDYKTYLKINFSLCLRFVKQTKNKIYISNGVFMLLIEGLYILHKHKSLYQKCNIITVNFLLHFLLHWMFVNFTEKFVVLLYEISSETKVLYVVY